MATDDDDQLLIQESLVISNIKVHTSKVLGKGSYGIVYQGEYHGAKVACKKLHTIFFESVSREENIGILSSWKNELFLMSSVLHPNIVQFYGVYNSDDSKSVTLSGSSYIVSELMDKSLRVRNLEKSKLNYKEIIDILCDIAAGLCYLHERPHPIMHRDLASKNILLTRYGQAKIADLGVAKITSEQKRSHTRHPGTDVYMPVETIVFGDAYDHTIDVYALGVIALELAIGRDPVATQSLKKVGDKFEAVAETERRSKDFDTFKNSENFHLQDFVLSCLAEVDKRVLAVTALDILETLKDSDKYKSIPSTIPSTAGGPVTLEKTTNSMEEKYMQLKSESEVMIDQLQRTLDDKNEELAALHKEEKIKNEEVESLRRDVDHYRKVVKEKDDKCMYYQAELERAKKSYETKCLELESKYEETTKLKRQLEPNISRNPPAKSKSHSGTTERLHQYVPPHSALVMPKSNVRGPYIASGAQVNQTMKPRPASTIVTGSSSSSGGRNFLSQRSRSEDDYLSSSDNIRHPPALPAEYSKEKNVAYGSSTQPHLLPVDSVVLELRNFSSQIMRLFDMLKTAGSATVMAGGMSNLKAIMNSAQRYISSIPSHVKVTEVQHLITNLEEKFTLLKSVNLDKISASNTDEISQAARMLQPELFKF